MAAALDKLKKDGTYERILAPWGLKDAAVKQVTVNLKPLESRARRRNEKEETA